jgi:hypothetical protein
MFLFGGILAVIVGGLVGFWFGSSRARQSTNSEWMRALEEAKTNGIIDEQQSSDIIRMQGSSRAGGTR